MNIKKEKVDDGYEKPRNTALSSYTIPRIASFQSLDPRLKSNPVTDQEMVNKVSRSVKPEVTSSTATVLLSNKTVQKVKRPLQKKNADFVSSTMTLKLKQECVVSDRSEWEDICDDNTFETPTTSSSSTIVSAEPIPSTAVIEPPKVTEKKKTGNIQANWIPEAEKVKRTARKNELLKYVGIKKLSNAVQSRNDLKPFEDVTHSSNLPIEKEKHEKEKIKQGQTAYSRQTDSEFEFKYEDAKVDEFVIRPRDKSDRFLEKKLFEEAEDIAKAYTSRMKKAETVSKSKRVSSEEDFIVSEKSHRRKRSWSSDRKFKRLPSPVKRGRKDHQEYDEDSRSGRRSTEYEVESRQPLDHDDFPEKRSYEYYYRHSSPYTKRRSRERERYVSHRHHDEHSRSEKYDYSQTRKHTPEYIQHDYRKPKQSHDLSPDHNRRYKCSKHDYYDEYKQESRRRYNSKSPVQHRSRSPVQHRSSRYKDYELSEESYSKRWSVSPSTNSEKNWHKSRENSPDSFADTPKMRGHDDSYYSDVSRTSSERLFARRKRSPVPVPRKEKFKPLNKDAKRIAYIKSKERTPTIEETKKPVFESSSKQQVHMVPPSKVNKHSQNHGKDQPVPDAPTEQPQLPEHRDEMSQFFKLIEKNKEATSDFQTSAAAVQSARATLTSSTNADDSTNEQASVSAAPVASSQQPLNPYASMYAFGTTVSSIPPYNFPVQYQNMSAQSYNPYSAMPYCIPQSQYYYPMASYAANSQVMPQENVSRSPVKRKSCLKMIPVGKQDDSDNQKISGKNGGSGAMSPDSTASSEIRKLELYKVTLQRQAKIEEHLNLLRGKLQNLQKNSSDYFQLTGTYKESVRKAIDELTFKLHLFLKKEKENRDRLASIKSKLDSKVFLEKDDKKEVEVSEATGSADSEAKGKEDEVCHIYYDEGGHWCQLCNQNFDTLSEKLQHLLTSDHQEQIDPYERPWPSAKKPEPQNAASPNKVRHPIKGSEFIYPTEGFYCKLCQLALPDKLYVICHLQSAAHHNCYKKYAEENPEYEIRYEKSKEAGMKVIVSDMKRKLEEEQRTLQKHNKIKAKNLEQLSAAEVLVEVEKPNSGDIVEVKQVTKTDKLLAETKKIKKLTTSAGKANVYFGSASYFMHRVNKKKIPRIKTTSNVQKKVLSSTVSNESASVPATDETNDCETQKETEVSSEESKLSEDTKESAEQTSLPEPAEQTSLTVPEEQTSLTVPEEQTSFPEPAEKVHVLEAIEVDAESLADTKSPIVLPPEICSASDTNLESSVDNEKEALVSEDCPEHESTNVEDDLTSQQVPDSTASSNIQSDLTEKEIVTEMETSDTASNAVENAEVMNESSFNVEEFFYESRSPYPNVVEDNSQPFDLSKDDSVENPLPIQIDKTHDNLEICSEMSDDTNHSLVIVEDANNVAPEQEQTSEPEEDIHMDDSSVSAPDGPVTASHGQTLSPSAAEEVTKDSIEESTLPKATESCSMSHDSDSSHRMESDEAVVDDQDMSSKSEVSDPAVKDASFSSLAKEMESRIQDDAKSPLPDSPKPIDLAGDDNCKSPIGNPLSPNYIIENSCLDENEGDDSIEILEGIFHAGILSPNDLDTNDEPPVLVSSVLGESNEQTELPNKCSSPPVLEVSSNCQDIDSGDETDEYNV